MTAQALEAMFDTTPVDWWRFVPCATCNARRQQPCQATDGPARRPHASRRRMGRVLWGTLRLLAQFPQDVPGTAHPTEPVREPEQR